MTTKICTNEHCPAYAHFVYTVAMRCVLCRCDLAATRTLAGAHPSPATHPAKATHAARS